MSYPQPSLHVFIPPQGDQPVPVKIGVPFLKGQIRDRQHLVLISPEGQHIPASLQTLIRWDDDSVRWGLLRFLASENGLHTVELSDASSPSSEQSTQILSSTGKMRLTNGIVDLTLTEEGDGPIESLLVRGRPYLAQAGDFRLVVDEADSRHETHRSLRVLADTPECATVRVEGGHYDAQGNRKLDYRLDAELWKGWSAVRLSYHFFNREPGKEHVDIHRLAMEMDFALGKQTQRRFQQHVHGIYYQPREVVNPEPVALIADTLSPLPRVEDVAMLRDDTDYPPHLHPPLDQTAEWMGIHDTERSVFFYMQDFAAMRPKRLVSEGHRLALEIWPERAGLLELPQGWSRQQIVTLAFFEETEPAKNRILSALRAPLAEGRACVDPAWLAHCGEFEQDRTFRPGQNVRFDQYLNRLMRMSLPQTMFDLGDTPDSGYLRTYTPLYRLQKRLPHTPEVPRVLLKHAVSPWATSGQTTLAPYAQPEFYEPVWANNEYDLIHAFSCEIMRTANPDYWTTLRFLARHNIEVDFLHYHDDRWQHRATPAHSARHTTTGAYPSHFWTQGLLEYYCLTGDPDVLEVAVALGDKIIENFTDAERRKSLWGFNRELGWPVLALSHLAELTGEKRFRTQLDEIIDFLMEFKRDIPHYTVKLSGINPRHSFMRQVVSSFFGWASMFEGTDHYARWSGRKDLQSWVEQFTLAFRNALRDAFLDGEVLTFGHMHTVGLSVGLEHATQKEDFLQLGMLCLRVLTESPMWSTPTLECKPVAMTHRGLMRILFHAQTHGLLQILDYPEIQKIRAQKS